MTKRRQKRTKKQEPTNRSQVQQRYYVALAAYNTAIEERNRQYEPYTHLLETEAGIDEFLPIEEKIETKLKIGQFRAALREAENVLISWAIDWLKADPVAYAHLVEIAMVAEVALSGRMPNIRKQVIEMCVRMAG